jgi:hypothetical protein
MCHAWDVDKSCNYFKTMNVLFEKYGYCLIPENTFLFRSKIPLYLKGGIFFELHAPKVKQWGPEKDKVVIWKTNKPIKLLFALTDIYGIENSSLKEIYNEYISSEHLTSDLCIKHNKSFNRQPKLVQLLKENGCDGWMVSVEGNGGIEVCLFPNDTELNDWLTIEREENPDKIRNINSLKDIHVFPTNAFMNKAKESLTKNRFYKPLKNFKDNVKNDMQYGDSKEEAEAFNYNLEVKLYNQIFKKK